MNTLVGYGDSNTRYFEGDISQNGPINKAYTSYLASLVENINIINKGYPGERISFGVKNFYENVIDNNADIVVLGFGTNDIKHSDYTLEAYIDEMRTLIGFCKEKNILTFVLCIPWFDERYAGNLQERLPIWNNALKDLCLEQNVSFIDTFEIFKADPDKYFNEKVTSKRHLSEFATQIIAQKIAQQIK